MTTNHCSALSGTALDRSHVARYPIAHLRGAPDAAAIMAEHTARVSMLGLQSLAASRSNGFTAARYVAAVVHVACGVPAPLDGSRTAGIDGAGSWERKPRIAAAFQ